MVHFCPEMEGEGSSAAFVPFNQTTWHHAPADLVIIILITARTCFQSVQKLLCGSLAFVGYVGTGPCLSCHRVVVVEDTDNFVFLVILM
jgi:hypothetical protein